MIKVLVHNGVRCMNGYYFSVWEDSGTLKPCGIILQGYSLRAVHLVDEPVGETSVYSITIPAIVLHLQRAGLVGCWFCQQVNYQQLTVRRRSLWRNHIMFVQVQPCQIVHSDLFCPLLWRSQGYSEVFGCKGDYLTSYHALDAAFSTSRSLLGW